MNVPFLDLLAQFAALRDEVQVALNAVCERQSFILGPQVAALEREVAEYCGVRYAVGVSSGTDALLSGLMALGIGPGEEVITTPYTFFATTGSIVRTGARPVFVDIDPTSFNLDPSQVEDRVTSRTRALLPVHLFGRCADMEPLLSLAARHGLAIIEDAAQAIGAQTNTGGRAGGIGTLGCLSFYPTKNLGGFGDGGMILTNNPELTDLLRSLRNHGSKGPYEHPRVGGNFRLDEIQAAILLVKLKHLEGWIEARGTRAQHYHDAFQALDLEGPDALILPDIPKRGRHVFHQYVIRTRRRDDLARFLTARGIGTAIYYPKPLHLQDCFAFLGYKEGSFPESERAARETLALPIYPELTAEMQTFVIEGIDAFFRGR
ncbi:MAG: DegT/DnrJ/EryC1/StrS family aminotransferase [Candidatus Methylomirabilis oxyfera]|nr:DegT/DnrJ/EryC1/StrS family aminotransferase [Candidatus Methylomirabilis oxyfera]